MKPQSATEILMVAFLSNFSFGTILCCTYIVLTMNAAAHVSFYCLSVEVLLLFAIIFRICANFLLARVVST